jgi:hypothetical protein
MTAYVYVLSPKSEPNVVKLGKAESVEKRFNAFNKIGYCGFDDWEVRDFIELDDDRCARKTEKSISKQLKTDGLYRGKVKHLYPAKNDYEAGTETYNTNLKGVQEVLKTLELPRNSKIVELEQRVLELEFKLSKFTSI